MRDAQEYINKLHKEHGYEFHCISSMGNDEESITRRTKNLNDLFGTAFASVTCLSMGSEKITALSKYKDSGYYWVEDHIKNADDGHNLGLRSLLMRHSYNEHHNASYPIVNNWREIYEIITQ